MIDLRDLSLEDVGFGCWNGFSDGFVHVKTMPYLLIAEVLHGQYEFTCRGDTAVIAEGQTLFAPANEELRIVHRHGEKGYMHSRWVHLRFTLYGAIEVTSLLDSPILLPENVSSKVSAVLQELDDMSGEAPLDPLWASARRVELVFGLLRHICEISSPRMSYYNLLTGAQRFQGVLSHVQANLGAPLDAPALAKVAGMSLSSFHKHFKEQFDTTPMAYVKERRINRARQLLGESDAPLSVIAEEVGFKNQFHFSREFRLTVGVPPLRFRKERMGQMR